MFLVDSFECKHLVDNNLNFECSMTKHAVFSTSQVVHFQDIATLRRKQRYHPKTGIHQTTDL